MRNLISRLVSRLDAFSVLSVPDMLLYGWRHDWYTIQSVHSNSSPY